MMQLKTLAEKAMLVQLRQSKPRLATRNKTDEQSVQDFVGDRGAVLYTRIFVNPNSAPRAVINAANAVYTYHKDHTLPYIDRGPRLLPVANYESYRDNMRKLVDEVAAQLQRLQPTYPDHILTDIQWRNEAAVAAGKAAKALPSEYPAWADFERSLQSHFTFSPLADNRHWLFDVSQEDQDALQQQMTEIEEAAKADMRERIAKPLAHLSAKLKIPVGEKGSIFRDSAVENVIEAIDKVRVLSLGDESIERVCDEVEQALSGHARNPQVLRDSPIVREQAAAKLAAIEAKMGWMIAPQPEQEAA